MERPITVLVESEILPGRADPLREVLDRVIAHCRETEPGMLAYDWYVDAAGTEARVVEIYQDSEAVLFHFRNYAPFQEELSACRRITRLQVLGEPSAALTEALRALEPPTFTWMVGIPAR